jgi:enoyl-CoA hydratase/carnithine racemase
MTSETPVIVDVRGGYRVITLNRPDKLNAFNEAMHRHYARPSVTPNPTPAAARC